MSKVTYEVITQEDPDTKDIILPIPQELLDQLGWREGEELEWNKDSNGNWIVTRKL